MSPMSELCLSLSRRQWRGLLRDLAGRGGGVRESGAFLLAHADGRSVKVIAWVAFDELDPQCLTGGISMRGEAFNLLWKLCCENDLRVIADVHTHPGEHVEQSALDWANPMVAQCGHVAVIVPRYAKGCPRPRHVGVHIYRGARCWDGYYGEEARRRVRLRWW